MSCQVEAVTVQRLCVHRGWGEEGSTLWLGYDQTKPLLLPSPLSSTLLLLLLLPYHSGCQLYTPDRIPEWASASSRKKTGEPFHSFEQGGR